MVDFTPTPGTDEVRVNTLTTNFQHNATVAALESGGYVVVWESGSGAAFDIRGQIYDASGNPEGDELLVNTSSSQLDNQASVVGLPDGGFVVVWSATGPDAGPNFGILGRRFDAAGAAVGTQFHIDAEPPPANSNNAQVLPTVALLPDSHFVVTWTAGAQDGNNTAGIYGRIYDASGASTPVPLTGEIHINTTIAGNQRDSSVTALTGGGFVVAWASSGFSAHRSVLAQLFDASGAPVGGELEVFGSDLHDQIVPSIAALAGGGFVVTWSSAHFAPNGFDIAGQIYGSDGVPVGDIFTINTVTGNAQVNSSVVALEDGGFAVIWRSLLAPGGPGTGSFEVFGQRFDASGAKLGDELPVNQTITGTQEPTTGGDYALAQLASGELVVVWSSAPPSDFPDVFARRFTLPGTSVVGSTDSAIDLSDLVDIGSSVIVADNGSAATIDLSNLEHVGGDVSISNNTSATGIELPLLEETGGSVSISANASATGIELPLLEETGGDVSISNNTSATGIDLPLLEETGGSVSISANASATGIELPGLTTTGGGVSVTENASATGIDLPALRETGGSVAIDGNESVTGVNLPGLTDVSGDVTIEVGDDATAVDASGLGPGGGQVVFTGGSLGTVTISLGSLANLTGRLVIRGAGGVELTALAGLAEIVTTGTAGADNVTGSATAANKMDGGAGDDRLTGGAGADTFTIGPNGGLDTIVDLGTGDRIDFTAVGFSAGLHMAWQSTAAGVQAFALENASNTILATVKLAGHYAEGLLSVTDDGSGHARVLLTHEPQSLTDTQNFNGDGFSDILFQHTSGAVSLWEMNGTSIIGGAGTLVGLDPGPTWHAKATGDVNGDGKSDILFQHESGLVSLWELDGTNVIGGLGTLVGPDPGPTWHAKATGDFNGDGKSDILFQHESGLVSLWELDGTAVIGGAGTLVGPDPGPTWQVKATGDFNGDGTSDILFQHTSGLVSLWELDGTEVIGGAGAVVGASPGPTWHAKAAGDFNGDGKSDILFQEDSGLVSLWELDGTAIIGGLGTLVGPNPGPDWEVKATGDYNNDGRSDLLFQHTGGAISLWELDGNEVIGGLGTLVSSGDPSWLVA